jgi:hypothetical protein
MIREAAEAKAGPLLVRLKGNIAAAKAGRGPTPRPPRPALVGTDARARIAAVVARALRSARAEPASAPRRLAGLRSAGQFMGQLADKELVCLLGDAPTTHPPRSIGLAMCLRRTSNPTGCANRGGRIASGRESRPPIVAHSGARAAPRRYCPPRKFCHAAVFNRQAVPSIDRFAGSPASQGSEW